MTRDPDDFADEIASHLAHEIDRLVVSGMSPTDAAAAARRRFGNVTLVRETHFEANATWWHAGALRLVIRRLIHAPLFSTAFLLMLAVATASIALVFGIYYGLELQPLPFRDNHALVEIWATDDVRDGSAQQDAFTAATWRAWYAGQTSFVSMSVVGGITLTPRDRSLTPIAAAQVDGRYFRTLGIGAMLGRTVLASDDAANALPVIVLSHATWEQAFRGDRRVVGSIWHLNTVAYVIIGVMPASADVLATSAWVSMPGGVDDVTGEYSGIARLRPGVTMQRAQRDLDARTPIPAGLHVADPRPGALVLRLTDEVRHASRTSRLFAVAIVLLFVVALVNLMTLSLVRALGRVRQTAISTALGATRGRLRRDAAGEGLLLGSVAALAAWGIARWARLVLAHFTEVTIVGRPMPAPPAWIMVIFVGSVAVCSGVAIAVSTFAITSRIDLNALLHGGGAGAGTARLQGRWRRILVGAQVALAVIVCGIAARLTTSAHYLSRIPLGYDAAHVMVAPLDIWTTNYGTDSAAHRLVDRIVHEFAGTAGLGSPAIWATIGFPMPRGPDDVSVKVEGSPVKIGIHCNFSTCAVAVHPASPNLFTVLGIALRQGRAFDVADTPGSAPVAIVNTQAVHVWFNGANPVGRRMQIRGRAGLHAWRTIVGVVSDASELNSSARIASAIHGRHVQPLIYIPLAQADLGEAYSGMDFPLTVGVDVTGPTGTTARLMRAALQRAMPDVDPPNISTMSTLIARDGIQSWVRLNLAVAVVATIVIVLLAVIGIGGVVAESVRHRTRELGVRMALGADARRLVRLICTDAATWLAAGVAAGLIASRLMQSVIARVAYGGTSQFRPDGALLFGPHPPLLPLIAGAVVICAFGLLAALIPAIRAARLDPAVVLRDGAD